MGTDHPNSAGIGLVKPVKGLSGKRYRMVLGVVLIVQSGLFFAVDQGNLCGGVPLSVLILGAILVSLTAP